MQVRTNSHTIRQLDLKEVFERGEGFLNKDMKQFFNLFQESTFEGSQAAALKMKFIAKRQTKHNQKVLLFRGLHLLVRFSNSEMLSWPNSPLLVMLQFIDPSVLLGDEEKGESLLHHLADLADPFNYTTHENQLILAKQLIEHGASVNAVSIPDGMTPLHRACFSAVVTNLDFVEYLLEAGANPNAQDPQGKTPLMYTTPYSPGAAKFLLNWPTTDANIKTQSGQSFLAWVRSTMTIFSDQIGLPDNPDPDRIKQKFLLQQWCGIEDMLLERFAYNTGITVIDQGYGLVANAWSSDTKNGVIFGGLAIFFALFIGGY
jgi:hypothetical protein